MDSKQEEALKIKEICSSCNRAIGDCACAVDESDATIVLKGGSAAGEASAATDVHASDGFLNSCIAGKYRVTELLGEGGMGRVFKADHVLMNKTLAVKVLRSEVVTNSQAVKRFDQEAKASSNLTHPNLCAVYDYGVTDEGCPYLVMDYLEGENLSAIIEKEGHLEAARVVDIFVQVTEAVAYAHAKGVIHRDLKPSNIVIQNKDGHESVKIVDFGIAKVLPPPGKEGNDLTLTGEIFGSPLYMSPEQCLGNKLDARSDIYSLGCVLYECLSGKPPLSGENPIKTIMRHVQDPVPPFDASLNIPIGLQHLVLSCLEKKPDERYQSADELRKDFESVRHGKLPQGHKKTGWYYFVVGLRKIKWYAAIIVISTCLAVLAAILVTVVENPLGMQKLAIKMLLNQEGWEYALTKARNAIGGRNYSLAETKFKDAMREAEKSIHPVAAKLVILQEMGDFYMDQAQRGEPTWEKALASFNRARELAFAAGADSDRAHALERMGECMAKLGKYKEAEENYDQAMIFRKASPGEKNVLVAITLGKQADNYQKLDEPDKALQAYQDAAGILEALPEQKISLGNMYKGMAQCYSTMHKMDQASDAYKRAEDTFVEIGDTPAATDDLRKTLREHIPILQLLKKDEDARKALTQLQKLESQI